MSSNLNIEDPFRTVEGIEDIKDTISKINTAVETLEKANDAKTFVITLKLILETSSFQDKYNVKLNPEIMSILNQILNINPDYFNSVETLFLEIINNKTVNPANIPEVILLVKKLYEILYGIKVKDVINGISIDTCVTIFKFIVNVLIVDNIQDSAESSLLVLTIDTIIDSCAQLITIRKILKNNNGSNLFSCLVRK
jgi:hypothetical protein